MSCGFAQIFFIAGHYQKLFIQVATVRTENISLVKDIMRFAGYT